MAPTLSTQEKALRINLSRSIYGSFAEIGGGQEVAANFFKVGGASGTVAKTISAYDMKFSDAISAPPPATYAKNACSICSTTNTGCSPNACRTERKALVFLPSPTRWKPSTLNAPTKDTDGWDLNFR